ncbi:unnamed protein product [Eruca vesicaria subsp. sativa]|uniref:Protein kinase domain-containing protein n=1 Tax=Eruca vesicaria subsp. sativa TaxID=29727 RepID=A0ABC8KQP2_ERUVS|nr:unnamed protein product [Eruca vesicaria subsp. sativa]
MDNKKLPEPLIKDFTRMILEGLVSIHGHGYVQCDFKSDNLLVFPCGGDDSYELKICDFGVSLDVGDIPDYWDIDSPFVGTASYMSPESVEHGGRQGNPRPLVVGVLSAGDVYM